MDELAQQIPYTTVATVQSKYDKEKRRMSLSVGKRQMNPRDSVRTDGIHPIIIKQQKCLLGLIRIHILQMLRPP